MSRFAVTFAFALFSLTAVACSDQAEEAGDVSFREQVAAMNECRAVCASMASVCGAVGNDCETQCVNAMSAETRTCLSSIDSCDDAASCTADHTIAQTDVTASASAVR